MSSIEQIPFGSDLISTTLNNNNGVHTINAAFVNSYDTTDDKLLLGGVPLTLTTADGYYFLHTIKQNIDNDTRNSTIIQGSLIETWTSGTETNTLSITHTDNNNIVDHSTSLLGMPLGITANNELMFTQQIGLTVDSTEIFIWGNQMMSAANVNGSYYLIIKY